jgi:hypothetical protein
MAQFLGSTPIETSLSAFSKDSLFEKAIDEK